MSTSSRPNGPPPQTRRGCQTIERLCWAGLPARALDAGVNPATIATLAASGYLHAGEPVVLLGDSGTSKTHLLIGLGIAACEEGRRVRYVTCAQLVNELVEAVLRAEALDRLGRTAEAVVIAKAADDDGRCHVAEIVVEELERS